MRYLISVILGFCLAYASFDLLWPMQRDLRHFNPAALGELEAQMWKSYYARERVALFLQAAEMLRRHYHFPVLRSYLGAYHAASAAFIFKDGERRSDYEKALPALRRYFAMVRRSGNLEFDVTHAARLELEWWIVHRERERYRTPESALGRACAEAAEAVYSLPAGSTLEYGRLRAQAMLMRDTRESSGSVTPADWAVIQALLRQSYQSLHKTISAAARPPANVGAVSGNGLTSAVPRPAPAISE
jgi:hypothetical protein